MTFNVDIGVATRRGPRAVNEDCAAYRRMPPGEQPGGLVACIADGVSGGGGGREAAQAAVASLLADFFSAPPTWETTVALDRVIAALNGWLFAHNQHRQSLAAPSSAGDRPGAAVVTGLTTLTALVLQGQLFTLAHVGDTRLWRLHRGELQLLTMDHTLGGVDQRSALTRAMGLDDFVRVDYSQGEVAAGDVFLLTSDGVHGTLKPARLLALLQGSTGVGSDAQTQCDALVQAALAAGSIDNASALVVRVLDVDTAQLRDHVFRQSALPALGPKRPGDVVDGYTITAVVADTGVHRIFQARERGSGRLVALKALHESRASDAEERAMLAHEAWLGQRITERDPRGFVRVHELHNATAAYTVFDWHPGRTLEQLMAADKTQGQPAPLALVLRGAAEVARAIGRLHRQGVVHRDIKPANIHLGDDGQWRIFDLGVALSGREGSAARELHAGTPSYMNPEQWVAGAAADAGSDLYAFGVTLYQWITGHLPYGEVEPYQTGRYRRPPKPLSRLRPDVPMWLDHLVLKSVSTDAAERFETAEELLLALDRGAARPLAAPRTAPLLARDKLVLWQIGCGVLALFNALLIFWLLYLPR